MTEVVQTASPKPANRVLTTLRSLTRTSQLKKNMAAGVVCSGLSAVLMAVSYPLYLRFLGFEQYGLWLVIGTVLSFAQLSNLGLGQAVSQQVASDHSRGDHNAVDTSISTALCTLLVSGGVVCGAVSSFRHAIASYFHLSSSNSGLVSSLLPAVAFLSLYAMYLDTLNSTLAGVGRMDLYLYLQLLSQLLSVTITLVLLGLRQGLASFVLGNAISYIILHIVSALTLKRFLGRRVFRIRYFSFPILKKILGLSLYLTGCSILRMLGGPLNKLLLARYVGLSTLPTYDIIINGSMKLRSLLEAAMRALMPEISRLAARGDHAGISVLNRRISRNLFIGGTAAFAVFLAVCGFGVRLWLGKLAVDFPIEGLRIILIGTFFGLLGIPPFYTLLGLGKSATLFIANVLQSGVPIISIFAILLLGSPLSLMNVLQVVAIGMVIANLYLLWQNNRAIKFLSRVA